MGLMARNMENLRFFKDGCWKNEHSTANSMIFRFPPISASPSENWGSIFCYHLHDAAAGFRGSRSDGQKHGKSKVFQGWLLDTSIPSSCGSPSISASPTEN